MKKALLTGVAVLFLTMGTAQAAEVDENSANFWLPHCKRDFEQMRGHNALEITQAAHYTAMCFGIIEGIAYTLDVNWMMIRDHKASGKICINLPKHITKRQIRLVVIKWIEERPEEMHDEFREL